MASLALFGLLALETRPGPPFLPEVAFALGVAALVVVGAIVRN